MKYGKISSKGKDIWRELNNIFVDSINMSCVKTNQVFAVSGQVQHKPGCTATEDGERIY